ncbi:MAG: hypothetical protein R2788_20080, partial [Saprospiraceae bacterium]
MKKSVFTLSIFFLTIWFGQAQEIQLIKDFVSGNDGLDIIDHVVIADQLFFTVENDSTQQTNLWVTDGTLDGSVLLHDSLPLWNVAKGEMLSVFADKCYFPAFDNEHGYELWRTDGSLVGTELFVDIIDGPESSAPSGMEVLNSSLLIWASKKNGNDLERAIYRSDGITPTVELITAIDPCFFNNNKALNTKANIGGTIYFSYYLDYCLWKTDGTAQ